MLHVGHAAEHRKHTFGSSGVTESPRSHAVVGTALLVLLLDVLVDLSESAAEQWLHYHHRYVTLMQFVVEIFGIGVARIARLGMLPVEIVHLYLHEVPANLALVLHLQKMVKYLHISVIGESEITYIAFLALILKEIEHAVVDEAVVKLLYTTHSHTMKQHVVDIVDLQLLQRFAVYVD